MVDVGRVAEQYSSGTLWERLVAALAGDGVDLDAIGVADLAPYDQFHTRGLEATVELADTLDLAPSDHVLDVGCGLGGPARVLAERLGCRVTGIDLTPEFCEVAERLGGLTGLGDRVHISEGSALEMPFEDATFDGAYSMNVSMNIADRDGLYRELHRVLRPRGWVVFSELAQGPNTAELQFPLPWARTADGNFLLTPDETCELLEACGYTVAECIDKSAANREYQARIAAAVQPGDRPPIPPSVALVYPDVAADAMRNVAEGSRAGQLTQIEIRCHRTR